MATKFPKPYKPSLLWGFATQQFIRKQVRTLQQVVSDMFAPTDAAFENLRQLEQKGFNRTNFARGAEIAYRRVADIFEAGKPEFEESYTHLVTPDLAVRLDNQLKAYAKANVAPRLNLESCRARVILVCPHPNANLYRFATWWGGESTMLWSLLGFGFGFSAIRRSFELHAAIEFTCKQRFELVPIDTLASSRAREGSSSSGGGSPVKNDNNNNNKEVKEPPARRSYVDRMLDPVAVTEDTMASRKKDIAEAIKVLRGDGTVPPRPPESEFEKQLWYFVADYSTIDADVPPEEEAEHLEFRLFAMNKSLYNDAVTEYAPYYHVLSEPALKSRAEDLAKVRAGVERMREDFETKESGGANRWGKRADRKDAQSQRVDVEREDDADEMPLGGRDVGRQNNEGGEEEDEEEEEFEQRVNKHGEQGGP